MACMRSLPGESTSRDRAVTRPYTTAQAAHTRATTTPWFVRKLLNRNPPRSDLRAARGLSRAHLTAGSLECERLSGANARAVYRAEWERAAQHSGCRNAVLDALATGHPKPAA